MDEPLPQGPRVYSRVAVDGSVAVHRAPYVKAGAGVAGAVGSGTVTVGHLHRALEILQGAQDRGASPEEALAELEQQVPSMGEQLREQLKELGENEYTWRLLNFLVNLIRLYFDMTQ